MLPIFGPEQFIRVKGEPKTFVRTFENCETAAQYKIVVLNGNPDGTGRVKSAKIRLNGKRVIGPRDFHKKDNDDDDDDKKKGKGKGKDHDKDGDDGGRDDRDDDGRDEHEDAPVAQIEKLISVAHANELKIRINGRPGSFLTISIECTANCLDVQFTSPLASDTLNQSATLVAGTITSTAGEVGVVVNEAVGWALSGQFAVPEIPLAPGENTLVARATNACLNQATAAITVQAALADEPAIGLIARPHDGLAPLAVHFKVDAALATSIARYEWDFNGDGLVENAGSDLMEVTHTYELPGLYLPRVTMIDEAGNRHSASTVVTAFSFEHIDRLAREKLEGLKVAAQQQAIAEALQFIRANERARVRQFLLALLEDLPRLFTKPAEVRFRAFVGDEIVYDHLVETLPGQQFLYSLLLTRDADGIWRIVSF